MPKVNLNTSPAATVELKEFTARTIRADKNLPPVPPLAMQSKQAAINPRKSMINSKKDINGLCNNNKLPSIRIIPRVKGIYRYKLMPGNNIRVVLSSLRLRPWWHPAAKNNSDSSSSAVANNNNNNSSSSTSDAQASLIWEQYRCPKRYRDEMYKDTMLNHLDNNACLVSKKGLYFSLKEHCSKNNLDLLQIVPRTFYLSASGLKSGNSDTPDDLLEFNEYNNMILKQKAAAAAVSPNVTSPVLVTKEEVTQVVALVPTEGEDVTEVPTLACSITGKKVKVIHNSKASQVKPSQDIIWILKPARLTNRGYGIQVVRGVNEVMEVVMKQNSSRLNSAEDPVSKDNAVKEAALTKIARSSGTKEGWIVQEYMERPLLVDGRKFDIRCFVLLTHNNKQGLKAYFFDDAYVRTSCRKYELSNLDDREVHLTNDAVQKHSKLYSKFESGNKLNFTQWQESICRDYPGTDGNIVAGKIYPEIKRLTAISIAAVANELNSSNGSVVKNTFELLGYDYMVNDLFEPKLIEINSNPCLEFACPLLKEVITSVIFNTVRTAVDPILKPPGAATRTKNTDDAIHLIEEGEEKFKQIYPSS